MTRPVLTDGSAGAASSSSQTRSRRRRRNVCPLVAQREMAPRKKIFPARHWNDVLEKDYRNEIGHDSEVLQDAIRGLVSWVEAESFRHLSVTNWRLLPSTKAIYSIAFSPDGLMLASTHGENTVKIIDYRTGDCLRELEGHLSTPWVVRFHPKTSQILASGSLDGEVRIWKTTTSECIKSHAFHKSIGSISFHPQGKILAVASGHKLYIWDYSSRGDSSSPVVVLSTTHSIRAVSFQPHGGPFLLTAERTGNGSILNFDRIHELAPPRVAAELQSTARIRIWSFDISNPHDPLDTATRKRLIVPYAVLFSEMGAHFSPCGRFISACVASGIHQNLLTESGQDVSGDDTSLNLHSSVTYELHVYSLGESNFSSGLISRLSPVLVSRPIRTPLCLNSIQFSPTSEHILLAYGGLLEPLLRVAVNDGNFDGYTCLEVYRASDLQLVTAVSDEVDGVSVACFHPSAGCGLVYGTWSRKLVKLSSGRS